MYTHLPTGVQLLDNHEKYRHFQVKKLVHPTRLLRSKGSSAFGEKAGFLAKRGHTVQRCGGSKDKRGGSQACGCHTQRGDEPGWPCVCPHCVCVCVCVHTPMCVTETERAQASKNDRLCAGGIVSRTYDSALEHIP